MSAMPSWGPHTAGDPRASAPECAEFAYPDYAQAAEAAKLSGRRGAIWEHRECGAWHIRWAVDPCGLCGDRTEGGVTVPIVIPGEGNIEDRRLCRCCCARAYAALAGDGVNEPDWSDF